MVYLLLIATSSDLVTTVTLRFLLNFKQIACQVAIVKMNTFKLSFKVCVVLPLLFMTILGSVTEDEKGTSIDSIQIDQPGQHLGEKSMKEVMGVFNSRPVHPSNPTPQQSSSNKLDILPSTTGQVSNEIDYDYDEDDVMSDEERQKLTATLYYTLQRERKMNELRQKLNENPNVSMAQKEEMTRELMKLTEELAMELSGETLPSSSKGQSIKRLSCFLLALVLVVPIGQSLLSDIFLIVVLSPLQVSLMNDPL